MPYGPQHNGRLNGGVSLPEVLYCAEVAQGTEVNGLRSGLTQHRANPSFPSEYLLVSLTHGFPVERMPPRPRFDITTSFVAAVGDLCNPTFLRALIPFLYQGSTIDKSTTEIMEQVHADLGMLLSS